MTTHTKQGGRIILKKLRLIAAIAAGCLCLTPLAGCGAVETGLVPAAFDAQAVPETVPSGIVAENSHFRLEWNDEEKSVDLVDMQTGRRYNTNPSANAEVQYDEFGLPVLVHPMVSSALTIKYVDGTSGHLVTATSYADAVNGGRVSATALEDGVLVTYYFDEPQISVPVEYRLRETGLAVTVRTKDIREGESELAEISLAPFMCAVANDAKEGYLFVPSGSGALVYPKSLSATGSTYRQAIYGEDQMIEVYDALSFEEPVRLPVFGAKMGDSALCAIVEEGAESSMIDAVVGGSSYGYSAVYATLAVRGYTEMRVQAYTGNTIVTDYYTDEIVDTDFTVSYTPLTDDNADYIGMADTYRSYLKAGGALVGTDKDAPTYTVQLQGGFMTKKSFLGIPYSDLSALTTTKQAQQMLEELSSGSGEIPAVLLNGFGSTGTTIGKLSGGYTVHSNLGGVKGLNALAEYCADKSMTAYFTADVMSFSKTTNGWMKLFTAAQAANKKNLYPTLFDKAMRNKLSSTKYALLTRAKLGESVDILLDKTSDWKLSGLALSTLGNTSYSDYRSDAYYCKKDMDADAAAALQKVLEAGRNVGLESPNAYAAVLANQLFSVPMNSSKADIFDEDVPFYAAVFKGSVALSSTPVNLATNPQDALLNAVESGCAPSWSLMYTRDSAVLSYTSDEMRNGVYDLWKDAIIEDVQELTPYYKAIAGATISEHTVLENGVRVTTYSNGVSVAVNRGDTQKESPLGSVAAWGYRIGGVNG